jgi:TPR repeat protein
VDRARRRVGRAVGRLDVARQLRNGASLHVDETKIATALRPQAEKGDLASMRALAPMIIGGRGTKHDPAAGLAMLKTAAEKGSTEAERDLSRIYMNGAPGIPATGRRHCAGSACRRGTAMPMRCSATATWR